MNNILLAAILGVLVIIAGIVVYEFAEQQIAIQKFADAAKKQECLTSKTLSEECWVVLNG